MNEIAERYITSKELAEILDVSVRTINETIQKMNLAGTFQVTVKNGVATKLTEAQATLLKQEIAQHHNLQSRQIDSVTTELEENQKIVEVIQILQRRNQKYIDAGYFRVIESKYVTPLGETKISLKTVVFQKGVAYINKLLAKESA